MITPDASANTPPDRRAHRDWLVGLAELPPEGPSAAGTGPSRTWAAAGARTCAGSARVPGARVRLVGVDASAAAVAAAAAATGDSRVTFVRADLDARLPFDDASLDLVYSHNLLECLRDPGAHAREVARVLRPGGRVVAGHWDWDTQAWDGADKALVRRLVAAYADWQQAWMAHADGWMGRRLWGVFHASGLFDGAVHARVLTNTAYGPPWLGYENARAMGALARRGLAAPADVDRFLAEQAALAAAGRYVYAVTGFAYAGRRRTA